jgi:hypothetical protein
MEWANTGRTICPAELQAIQQRFPPSPQKPKSRIPCRPAGIATTYYSLLTRMAQKGVVLPREGQWEIHGELFAAYIQEVGASSRGRIWLEPETQAIYQVVDAGQRI